MLPRYVRLLRSTLALLALALLTLARLPLSSCWCEGQSMAEEPMSV